MQYTIVLLMDLTRWLWSPQLIVRSLTTLSVCTLTHLSHPTAAVLEYRKNHPPLPSCEETIKTTMTNNSTKNEEEDKDEEASFSEIYSDSDADSDDDER